MGVMPSNNLPPESQQWRRSVEKRLNDLTLSLGPSTQSGRLNAALSARRVADGKNQIFPQSTPPVALALNDLWIDTGASNALKLWNGTDWVPAPLGTASLSATAIDGMTITGALFQTTATANRGIKLDSSGLFAWDGSGNQTLEILSSSGNLNAFGGTITGTTFYTATTGFNFEISGDAIRGRNNTFLTGITINTNQVTISVGNTASELSSSRFKVAVSGTTAVLLNPSGLELTNPSDATQTLLWSPYATGLQATSAVIGTTTTTSNSAIWVSGGIGYQLRRNTSLRKYKVAYEDATDHDLLKFRPRKWFDRGQVEDAGLDPATATAEECLAAGLKWVPGFIAEEVEEDDDLFATYDGQVLAGAAYDRFAVAAYGTLKKMDKRLKKLEGND